MGRGRLKQSRERSEERTRRLFAPSLADVAEEQIKAGVYPGTLGPAFAEWRAVISSCCWPTIPDRR